MKQYKDAIIHAVQLVRHLKGQHAPDSELATAKFPLAVARTAARMLSRHRRVESEEEGDEGFDDAFLAAFGFGAEENEAGNDLFAAFGLGEEEENESGDDDFFASLGLGGGGTESGGGDFLSSFGLGGGAKQSGGGDFATGFGLLGAGLGGGEGGDDDFDFGAFMENFNQCGVDVDEMMGKAMGAYFLYGGALPDFNLQSPETYPGADLVTPILLAFKDDDEKDCSENELAQLLPASEEYMQCTGMSSFFDFNELESGALIQSIEGDCMPAFTKATELAASLVGQDQADFDETLYGEDSELGKLVKVCLKTLFGDNAVGNFVRYQYNHIDQTLGCFSKLGEDIPHCVLTVPTRDSDALSLPLSLEKKMACLLGASTDTFIELACTGLYEELDECLPEEYDNSNTDVIPATCGEDDTLMGMDMSVLTGNKIPAFCVKVLDEEEMIDTEEFQARFEYYNKNREYGWTIDTIVDGEGGADEDSQVVIHVATSEIQKQPEELYEENPTDIARVESLNWEDGEAEPEELDQKQDLASLLGKVVGIIVFAAIGLALLLKTRVFGALSKTSDSHVKNNISSKEYADLSFKVESPEMA